VHAEHYEPRLEGDDLWTFGQAHAVLRHALGAKEGDARQVAQVVEDFCQKHQLDFGAKFSKEVLDAALKTAAASVGVTLRPSVTALLAPSPPAKMSRGLRILVLSSGWGDFELRLLPQLQRFDGTHEVVSVEEDPHLSDVGAQVFRHARGDTSLVRHLALMPGEETTLAELLETLKEVYDLPTFDLVLLGGAEWASRAVQVQELLGAGALRQDAAVVLAVMSSNETQRYLQDLGDAFLSQVHDLNGETAESTVISTLMAGTGSEL